MQKQQKTDYETSFKDPPHTNLKQTKPIPVSCDQYTNYSKFFIPLGPPKAAFPHKTNSHFPLDLLQNLFLRERSIVVPQVIPITPHKFIRFHQSPLLKLQLKNRWSRVSTPFLQKMQFVSP